MKAFEHLPHRHPFVMLDRAQVIEEGRYAKGMRHITVNDPMLFPDGVMPQVFVIEAMAQISGIASGRKESSMLAALNNINFTGTVSAGDVLEVESTLERFLGTLCIFTCNASVSGSIIAEGGVILHFNEFV